MHSSNLRLVFCAVVAWLAWGSSYAIPIYIVLAFLLGFWSVWASQGMTVRRKLQIGTKNNNTSNKLINVRMMNHIRSFT